MMIILRPYQFELVQQARAAMTRSKSVLVQAATGAGKTALASYMVKGAQDKGKRVMFTVHRRDLIKQTAGAFGEFDTPFSYIASGHEFNPYSLTHICGIDTLKNRLATAPTPDLLIVDECHMANSEGWSKTINFYKQKGAFVIGLSATPWRLDGSGLGKHFDEMVCGPSVRWLIDNKFLSEYRYFAPSHVDMTGVRITMGDYNRSDLTSRMEGESKIVGDAIKHYKSHANGMRAIVYCASRVHSERVAGDFRNARVAAMHMDGETPMEERRRIINAYASGEISVITNVDLITTGFDLAAQVGRDVAVECIILLRPTKSLSLFLQMVGRGLRYKERPAIILDHADCASLHGLPDEEREWTLDARDKRAGGSGEKTIPTSQCEKCFYIFKPALQCPNCGFIRPVQSRNIEEVEGELEEITEWKKLQKRQEVGRAKTIKDLMVIARERGYKNGWVWKIAEAKGIKS